MTPAEKQAREVFDRDGYQCQYCGRLFSPDQPQLHKHHRVFVSQGGKDDIDNLATCCWECHHEHGALKNRRLIYEHDDTKIKELGERYSPCRDGSQ